MHGKGFASCLVIAAGLLVCNAAPAAGSDPLPNSVTTFSEQVPPLVEAWLEDAWNGELEDENRWAELIQALEMVQDVFPSGGPPLSFQYVYTPEETVAGWVPGRSAVAIAAVHEAMETIERGGFLDRMEALTTARRVVPPVQLSLIIEHGRLVRSPLSRLALKRRAASALAARMYLDAESGDYDAAIARLEAMLALARLSGHDPLWKGYEETLHRRVLPLSAFRGGRRPAWPRLPALQRRVRPHRQRWQGARSLDALCIISERRRV